MLKRLISFVLLIALIFLVTAVKPDVADAAMVQAPAAVQGVTYQFNDNVKFSDFSRITRSGNNLNIPGSYYAPGDVIVDQNNMSSLKILKINPDGSYLTILPSMSELFKEFDIPRQVIYPTCTDIMEYEVKGKSMAEYLAGKTQDSGSDGQSDQKKIMSGNLSPVMAKIHQKFTDRGTKVYEYHGVQHFKPFGLTSNPVTLYLDGALGVSPGIVADYSLSDGYEFGFVDAAQFIEVNMMFDITIQEELYLPVFSVGISIPKLGSIKLGVYLVVDMDGELTLTVNAQEGILATASVSGGTSWGFPTSFQVNKSYEQYLGAECDPMGEITAGLYITPLVSLEILDVDVFDAQFRVGFLGYAKVTESTMHYGVDFVVNAFVTILDDRTDLLKINIPMLDRNKSFRIQDDVIFYHSRLCVYQNKINVAAMTKRLAGTVAPNAPPFSDKLPFADRDIEIWYYKAIAPSGGNPIRFKVKTDANGCKSIDFMQYGIDVAKDDRIKITAPGFIGETDLIKSVTPFGNYKTVKERTDFYGPSKLRGDFFEDIVYFNTLSGYDLTGLDVPNTEISFTPLKHIYYEGPVTVYSTDKTTKVTEKAVFEAVYGNSEYIPLKIGVLPNLPNVNHYYNIKPNHEMRWQINVDGFIYGTWDPTGAGGYETTHGIVTRRMVEDRQAVIEDGSGNTIGIQHNVILHVIAVNKTGKKPYIADAKLDVTLGKVPPEYIQTFEMDKCLLETPYMRFPAANVRYPNHYEYYYWPPFPVELFKAGIPVLAVNAANNAAFPQKGDELGTVTSANYLWRWEEIKPNVPETVTIQQTIQSPTGAPQTIYVQKPNIYRITPTGTDLSPFSGIPVSYTDYNPLAGRTLVPPELRDDEFMKDGYDIYQMRHIVSGLTVEGASLEDPPFSPPEPHEKGKHYDDMFPDNPDARDIVFQFNHMRDYRQFTTSPLDEFNMDLNRNAVPAAVIKNSSVKPAISIKNFSSVPQWAKGYISAVVNNKIMPLDSQGNFPALQNTTRAEFCAAIVNALGLTSADTIKSGFPFSDVNKSDKNLNQMQTAYQCGIIFGSGSKFAPTSPISRQDAAAMLMRAFSLYNKNLIPAGTAGSLRKYADCTKISGYALSNLEQAVSMGFFTGDGKSLLSPGNNITNAMTARILWELKLKAVNLR